MTTMTSNYSYLVMGFIKPKFFAIVIAAGGNLLCQFVGNNFGTVFTRAIAFVIWICIECSMQYIVS